MKTIRPQYLESRLKHYLSRRDENSEAVIQDILDKVGAVSWDVKKALEIVVPTIEDRRLRNDSRRILMSVWLDAAESYYAVSSMNQPYICYVSDLCVLVNYKEQNKPWSTAVFSPEGKVKIPTEVVEINGNSMTGRGFFNAFNYADKRKKGLVFRDGLYVIPCIFDYVENDLDITMVYYKYVGFYIYLSDEPGDEDFGEKTIKISDTIYMIIRCQGLKKSHTYSDSMATPLYDGEPMTREEELKYVGQITNEVYQQLDNHYAALMM